MIAITCMQYHLERRLEDSQLRGYVLWLPPVFLARTGMSHVLRLLLVLIRNICS